MLKRFYERIIYEGYTYKELCIAGGGGAKSMPSPETPQAMVTSTSVGDLLEAPPQTLKAVDTVKIDAIDRKKLGTRGLQIPLQSSTSDTKTAANSGVFI
jgi:hypothetical protein